MAWRKSWSKQNLDAEGTKRKLTPEQRSVWDDLLDLAETSEVTGSVCAKPRIGFTVAQLSLILNTPQKAIRASLERFQSKEFDMIECNGTGVIVIKNWKKYQSEYQRQKGYRK